MSTAQRSDSEVKFFDAASRIGDPQFAEVLRHETDVGRTGLGVSMLQSVARRQLSGSMVVAAVIVLFAGLVALRPAHRDVAGAVAHFMPTVQQPTMTTPLNHRLAAAKHGTELP